MTREIPIEKVRRGEAFAFEGERCRRVGAPTFAEDGTRTYPVEGNGGVPGLLPHGTIVAVERASQPSKFWVVIGDGDLVISRHATRAEAERSGEGFSDCRYVMECVGVFRAGGPHRFGIQGPGVAAKRARHRRSRKARQRDRVEVSAAGADDPTSGHGPISPAQIAG